jgi:hypothetical protein
MTVHSSGPHNILGTGAVTYCPPGCPAHAEWLTKNGKKPMRALTLAEQTLDCPICPAQPGQHCLTIHNKVAARPHKARGVLALTGVVRPPSPEKPVEAAESPTTGRLDPSSVVRPGDAPIFDAMVAEKYAESRLGAQELAAVESTVRGSAPRRSWATRGIGRRARR